MVQKNVEQKNDENVIEMIRSQKPNILLIIFGINYYFSQKVSCVHIVLDCSDTHSVLNF